MNIEELEKIHELKEKGILTDEEFQIQKEKILNQSQDKTTCDSNKKINYRQNENKKIDILHIIGWLFGVPCVLVGISQILESNVAQGFVMFLAGLVVLPIVHTTIEKYLNINISRTTRIIIFFVLALISNMIAPSDSLDIDNNYDNNNKINNVISNNQKITPIKDFYCQIDDNSKTIILKKYEGDDANVTISSTYNIDGDVYSVTEIDDTAMFLGETIESVVIPKGISKIPANTFNSSTIEIIYLPKTIKNVEGMFGYMDDLKKVYYEGSVNEWNEILGNDEIPSTTIISYDYVYNFQTDTKKYTKSELITQKSDAEELGQNLGGALNGILNGINDSFED